MQPTKAITIVLVALILTGMCGFLLQPSHEEISVTTYDYKGNLTPSVLYSQIDDWTEYNPLSNVTGWRIQDGTDIPTTDNANQYVLDPSIIEYNPVDLTNPASSKIRTFTASIGTTYKGVYLFDYLTKMPDNYVLHCDDGFRWNMTTTNYSPPSVVSLNSDWKYELDGQSHIVVDITYDKFDEKWYPVAILDEDVGIYERVGDGRKASYNVSTENAQTLYSMFVRSVNDTTVRTLTQYVPVLTDATYVDVTKFVQVISGTAIWSNSQVNGIVNVLCSPNTVFVIGENASISFPDDFPYDYGLVTLDFINKSYTCKGVSSLSNTLAYSTVDYDYNMKVESVSFSSYNSRSAFVYEDGIMTVSKAIGGGASQFEPYAAIGSMTYDYYTVDMWPFYFVNHSTTSYKVYFPKPIEISEGVTTHVLEIAPGVTETMQFGTWDGDTEYRVGVEWKDGEGATQYAIFRVHVVPNSAISQYPAYKDSSAEFAPVTTLHIKTGDSSPAKVFIDSTVVAVDPSGLLWGDPSIPLNYFYPEQMTFDTRVLFNGFVKYGNSITINGQTFAIDDGRLVYTHTETVVPNEYPQISVRIVAPVQDLPAGHELMDIVYLGGYYDYPVIVETEVAFSGGVGNTTVTLPNGEFQLGIVKSSGKYTLVGYDGNGYEYNGEIAAGQTGTSLYRLPGEVTITDYLPLKGMAVDFYRDPATNVVTVSLVFTEQNDKMIDLGVLDTTPKTLTYTVTVYVQESGTTVEQTKTVDTIAGYVISADGTWFWQSGIYTINTALMDEVGLDWTSGQFGLTMAGCAFLMIFFMIISTAVLYRFTEMEFTFLDWLILGGVVILLLALAIM